jgi:hypothetical protein
MQIKTTILSLTHLDGSITTPTHIHKTHTNNKRWEGCGEIGTVGRNMVTPLWKIVWEVLKKLIIKL